MQSTETADSTEAFFKRARMVAIAREREIKAGWKSAEKKNYCPHTPHEKQRIFLSLTDKREVFFGGAAGGGKSDALLMAALQFVHIPKYDAILFRRTYANLSKPGALMDRSLDWFSRYRKEGVHWNEQKKLWTFPSGARIQFGHLEHENTKFDHNSAEYQFIGFDELTEFTKTQYLYLFSRLRKTEDIDVPLRMRAASNPPQEPEGEWVQEMFVPEDFFIGEHNDPIIYKDTIDEDGHAKRRIFVPSRLEHNPSINKEEYDESLSYLDEFTRHKLREGDWRTKKRGEILWMYSDEHVCISWSQFAAIFGERKIPDHWRKRVYQDAGTTPGHPNVISYLTTAGANAPIIHGVSLAGIAFVYRGHTTYQATTDEIADTIWESIMPHNEFDQIEDWQMSHEAESERLAYEKKGLPFRNWVTGKTRGIPQLQNAFSLRDTKLPHPFKPELLGHPKLMFIVADDQLQYAKDDLGLARWRSEAPAYKYAKPKSGEDPKILWPHPLFNDAMDTLRAAAVDYFPNLRPLTHDEEVEQRMSAHLRKEEVAQYYGQPGFAELTIARIQEQRQVEMRMEEERKEQQRQVNQAFGGGRRARLLGGRRR